MATVRRCFAEPGGHYFLSGPMSLHYGRTKSGLEGDFIVYGEDAFWALEVKNAKRIQPADLRGLRAFREDYSTAKTGLLYRGTERLVVDGIACRPVDEFLRELRPGRPLPV